MTAILLTAILLSPILNLGIGFFYAPKNPKLPNSLTIRSSILGLSMASLALVWVYVQGPMESALFGFADLGFSIRVDRLNSLLLFMINLIAFIVFRYSRNYMDGDSREGAFSAKLALTVALIQFFVLSGNLLLLALSWTGTSMALQRLLLFYGHRERARLAARKKFVVARIADILLISALALIYSEFHTAQLSAIFSQLEAGAWSAQLNAAAILMVLAAALKAVQIPFHSWLLEVMETPTPVSALLHAGLINAGPYLIIRFSPLISGTEAASLLLLSIGALSALYGTAVAPTQPAIKTSLAYSTIGHMGFSLMLSGLGLYSAALLHLMAHSFYKAHSFLSSGSQIDRYRNDQWLNQKAEVSLNRVLMAMILALVIFGGVLTLRGGFEGMSLGLLIVAAIIAVGTSVLLSKSFEEGIELRARFILVLRAMLVVLSFFILEDIIHLALRPEIAQSPELSTVQIFLSIGVLLAFTILALGTYFLPKRFRTSSRFRAMEIHLRNGFYLSVLTDRLFGSLKRANS
ncbi:proton-conducting transporter transmembrane domain-containing protein [Croceimicrobium hydrocarbonivorans]|uniref:Probable inorganic carbon transporter subunit DabB n=1 Tax=Croceimicrobium hydrocarbonivorans TaxID=2761580 RepID=A0A7H0VFU7_9FLAO|nr:proton-conducting transporter membrane subunit [Croceimicrobium hydrocarbonivorans]QNR24595.1 NADH/ubiquinone/plastoquinone (complex i) [Croceimicrobium hydrocarbonivorans]